MPCLGCFRLRRTRHNRRPCSCLRRLQAHYEGELDVLDEFIARIDRSSVLCGSSGGGDGDVFESHLNRTAMQMSSSLPQLLLQMQSQVSKQTAALPTPPLLQRHFLVHFTFPYSPQPELTPPQNINDETFDCWFETHRRSAAAAWNPKARASALDLVSSANFALRTLQLPPDECSKDESLQRVQDLVFRMHLSHAALFNAAQRCQQAAAEQQQRLAAIISQLPQHVSPSVASALQNVRRLAATSATHSELLQFCRERSAATAGAAALRQDVERLRASCDQAMRVLRDGNSAGRKLSTLAATYSQFLPAQQSIVQQYASSTALQQGEALLNDIVSIIGAISRASAFVSSLPIHNECQSTVTLPADVTAAASVPFFLAPETAIARVASCRSRCALTQSNAALALSVSRVSRGDPRWSDAVSEASLAVLKQRCAAAVSEMLPLLQPLRSAVSEAQEARAQVRPCATECAVCSFLLRDDVPSGRRSRFFDQAVVRASCCSRVPVGNCGWFDLQV